MCSDCWFTGAVTTGYKIHSTGEAVTTGYKIHSAGEAVTPGYKIHSVGGVVSTGHKTGSANFVPGRDKTSGVNFVPTGDKTSGVNFVPTGDKTSGVNFVPTGDKTDDVNFVPGRDKTAAADSVSGGYKTAATDDDNASPASATCMDAFTGTAWITFSATGHVGMVCSETGRGAFTVAGCFLLLPFGMCCAGCADVVMNSFFACRDDFIFSWFVISFLPLKEPLRVRGGFFLLEVL